MEEGEERFETRFPAITKVNKILQRRKSNNTKEIENGEWTYRKTHRTRARIREMLDAMTKALEEDIEVYDSSMTEWWGDFQEEYNPIVSLIESPVALPPQHEVEPKVEENFKQENIYSPSYGETGQLGDERVEDMDEDAASDSLSTNLEALQENATLEDARIQSAVESSARAPCKPMHHIISSLLSKRAGPCTSKSSMIRHRAWELSRRHFSAVLIQQTASHFLKYKLYKSEDQFLQAMKLRCKIILRKHFVQWENAVTY